MNSRVITLAGMILSGAALSVGCKAPEPAPMAPTTPATMPATMPAAAMPAMPAMPTNPPPAAKDLTHMLTKDEPFFTSEPTAGATPSGTLKEGSKVLVIIPGAEYSQVITETGVSAYTPTDGLKPIGK